MSGSAPSEVSMQGTEALRGSRLRLLKLVLRLGILAVVAWGIWRTVAGASDDFAAARLDWKDLHFGWLLLSGGVYLAGLIPAWLFWHRVLIKMGAHPGYLESGRAYYIGHLGKYVPGKALVVVLRTALIRGERVDVAVAATSVFVETLTMMAVGALVSALLLPWVTQETWLIALAVGLFGCAALPTAPPVFRRLVRAVGVRRANPHIDSAVTQLTAKLLASGWITIGLGWCLLGVSLWGALQALPALPEMPADISNIVKYGPLLTATVALALVAGFLSLLPGGIGVRELVVMSLLAGPLGNVAAIVSAVLLRVVWLVSELVVSSILYLIPAPATQSRRRA